ncbi:MAG TPA: MBL fold metallo-hydrolase [bacterium]|jgi:glyoxylase-like metal-dependent hydrolase (beta-lactamase superfamily II)
MILELIVTGPMQENCYIIADESTKSGFVIDPGWDADLIKSKLDSLDITEVTILCTHGHFDHISGVPELRELTGAKAYMNSEDNFFIQSVSGQTALMCGMGADEFEFDGEINDGDKFTAGEITLTAMPTPGHSPGGMSLYDGRANVFVGDALFAGSVGRVDLPKSSGKVLIHSLTEVLYKLPDDTYVYPGHGPGTTIGHEKQTNPFTLHPEYLLD